MIFQRKIPVNDGESRFGGVCGLQFSFKVDNISRGKLDPSMNIVCILISLYSLQ